MSAASFRVLREGQFRYAILAPFTRDWCVERFFASLAASDVPRSECSFTAYVDSADPALRDAVGDAALALDFAEVCVQYTAWPPPGEKDKASKRRWRHAAMRCATAGLVPDCERLLLLEDDTLIPRDTWRKLTRGLDSYDWVSGYEVGRWNIKCPGVWRIYDKMATAPKPGTGLEPVSATGLYCALTRPELYRMIRWDAWDDLYGHDVSCTYALTQAGYRLGVDWSVRNVHMTPEGDVTWRHGRPYSRSVEPVRRKIMTGMGFMEFDDEKQYPEPNGGVTLRDGTGNRGGKVYYAPHRVVVNGSIKYGKKSPIPWAEAVELARAGLISDPILNAELFEPRTDVKPTGPDEVKAGLIAKPAGPPYPCRSCGKEYKTEKGRDAHEAAKHGKGE